mgnify:CR=1 FL=1
MPAPATVACRGCDLVQRLPVIAPGGKARCVRCNDLLAARPRYAGEHSLAVACACAVVIGLANALPLMSLSAAGRNASTTLAGGVLQMWAEGSEITAVVVAVCAIMAPATYVLTMLAVLLAARRDPVPRWAGNLLEWTDRVRPWSMVEVLLLGILVALVKIAQLATVTPGGGMYALGTLVFLLPWFVSTLDTEGLWARVRWVAVPDSGVPREAGP